jgi:hypothetical protein
MNEFVLWMQGLDPVKVAANESFHSSNHRQAMQIHEFEKMRRELRPNLVQAHEEKLQMVGEQWKLKDATKSRLRFTEKQFEIAMKAGNR